MLSKIKNEPVVVGLMGFVGATVALLIAFGVHVSAVQREAIEAWVLASVVLAGAIRSAVKPMAKVKAEVDPHAVVLAQLQELVRSAVHDEVANIEAARRDPQVVTGATLPVVQQPPMQ
jgi:hypothetical protein